MNIDHTLKIGVAGRFRLVTRKADESISQDTGWFDNLILDAGLNRMGTGGWIGYAQVGTGSNTPVAADTALQTRVASTGTNQANSAGASASAPYYGYWQNTYRFAAGVAAGNLTEVGIGWGSTGSLFSRALILDGGGTPTSLTVLSDEYLDVYYEFRNYAPVGDTAPFVVTIGGVAYTMVGRAAVTSTGLVWQPGVSQAVQAYLPGGGEYAPWHRVYNGSLGAVTADPSGLSDNADYTVIQDAYSNNSLQRTFTVSYGLNDGNLAGGITAVTFASTIGKMQFSISPAIPKTNIKILTFNFRVSWSRR